ncbi:MAG TPA: 5-oxoprolinase subunit PxpA [Opitutaceae bacterium]
MSRPGFIDLNADVGEGCATDSQLVPLVSSVNIACGGHAGDLETMRRTVALALRNRVAIGAHPGFADRANFGRKELPVTPGQAAALVVEQTWLLESVASKLGASVGHIKLHGALYNMASRDRVLAAAIAAAISEAARESGSRWLLVALAGSELYSIARAFGLRVSAEAFADRSYRDDGTLAPRTEPGAVIADESKAASQAVRLAKEGLVRTAGGADVPVSADTICIHGDGPNAVALARRIRDDLELAGVEVRC